MNAPTGRPELPSVLFSTGGSLKIRLFFLFFLRGIPGYREAIRSSGSSSRTVRKKPRASSRLPAFRATMPRLRDDLGVFRLQLQRFQEPFLAFRQLAQLHEADCQLVEQIRMRRAEAEGLQESFLALGVFSQAPVPPTQDEPRVLEVGA